MKHESTTVLPDGTTVLSKFVQTCEQCDTKIYTLKDEYLYLKEVRRDSPEDPKDIWTAYFCKSCKHGIFSNSGSSPTPAGTGAMNARY